MKKHIDVFLFIFLGVIGLTCFIKYFDYVSREAALDFKITRQAALQKGADFFSRQGYDLKGYKSAISFDSDGESAEFVEKTLGLESANNLYATQVKIWYWQCRWFKPLQKEEFTCEISPEGEIIGFSHEIKEEDKGASLSQDSAMVLSDKALAMIPGLNLSDYHRIETQNTKRPNRMDYYFTYEHNQLKIGEGRLRVSVEIQGEKTGSISSYVHVPESYERVEEKKASYRNLISTIDSTLNTVLYIGLVITLLLGFRHKKLRWRLCLSAAAALGLFSLLNSWNSYPLELIDYNTTSSWRSFIFGFFGYGFLGAVFEFLGLWVLTAGAWYAYENHRQMKEGIKSYFVSKEIAPQGIAKATLIGYSAALIQLGYVAIFYMIGFKYLGVFSPADTKYSNYLTTWLPWLFPLTIAFSASINEELMYRLFSISFFRRWLKYKWIAILLPAFIWGFAHTFYPVEPPYIRGIEVGLVGIFLGLIYLRYGILTTVITHYAYDCILFGLPLLRSSNHYFLISGSIVILIMAIPGIALYLVSLRHKPKEILIEEDKTDHPSEEQELEDGEVQPGLSAPAEDTAAACSPDQIYGYKPLSRTIWIAIILLSIISIGIFSWHKTRQPKFEPYFKITKGQATEINSNLANANGIPTKGYIRITDSGIDTDSMACTFMLRNLSKDSVSNVIQALNLNRPTWTTHWFKAEDPEQLEITIDDYGRLNSYYFEYKEERPGPTLAKESAQSIAESFLTRNKIDLNNYALIEATEEKKPARMDHSYTYEYKGFNVKDLRYRLYITVSGDKISEFSKGFDIPESFIREYGKSTLRTPILGIIMVIIVFPLLILAIIQVFQLFKEKGLKWRKTFPVIMIITIISVIQYINNLPSMILAYSNNVMYPPLLYISMQAIGIIAGISLEFLLGWFFLAFCLGCYKNTFRDKIPFRDRLNALHPRNWTHPVFLQSLGLIFFFLLIPIGISAFRSELMYWFPKDLESNFWISFRHLDCYIPFISNLLNTVNSLISYPLFLLFIFSFLFKWLKKAQWTVLLMVILGMMIPWMKNNTWQFMLTQSVIITLYILFIAYILVNWVGKNWVFYLMLPWCSTFVNLSIKNLHTLPLSWKFESLFWALIGLAPIFYLLYLNFLPKTSNKENS